MACDADELEAQVLGVLHEKGWGERHGLRAVVRAAAELLRDTPRAARDFAARVEAAGDGIEVPPGDYVFVDSAGRYWADEEAEHPWTTELAEACRFDEDDVQRGRLPGMGAGTYVPLHDAG